MKDADTLLPPGFHEVREGGARLAVRDELLEPVRKALGPLYHAWSRIAQRRFTASGRSGVVSFPLGNEAGNLMVRRYAHGGLLAGILKDLYLGPGRAYMELAVSEAARLGGVRTPKAVGALAIRARGPFWRLAFMTREVSDSEDLVHFCCRLNDYPPETAGREKRGVIREAARQVRRMHDLGILHADLHLKNLLLRRREDGPPQVHVIDFDRAALHPELSPEQRLRNLKRLARSVRKVRVADAVLTDRDKIRFLRYYLSGAPDAEDRARLWMRKLARAGRGREVWWAATRAKRGIRGDRIGNIR